MTTAGGRYRDAGVDVAKGEEAVSRIADLVRSTSRPEVIGGIGGFGGAFAFDTTGWRSPVLVSSTDGVGTKIRVAEALNRFDTIGIDLVAMCVDDIVCVGAEPLFVLDYIVTGKLDPDQMTAIVAGVAEGCRQAECALIGGEMAEHPGGVPGEVDLAGFAVGAVERAAMLGPANVRVGDALIGLASPGLRSNGYSLARQVLLDAAADPASALDAPAWPGAAVRLGEELLRPSVIFAPAALAAIRAVAPTAGGRATDVGGVHAVAHITGGGIAANLVRVLPVGTAAVLRPAAWKVPEIFSELQRLGGISIDEMRSVFNMGLGMVLAADVGAVDTVLQALRGNGHEATVVGEICNGIEGVPPTARFDV